MKKFISALAVVVALSGTAHAQDFGRGLAAIDTGDYTAAIQELEPLAEQGDAAAQTLLGLLYRNGQGVPQDFTTAASWLRKASDQDVAEAQYELGLMYAGGRGVPENPMEAVVLYRKAAQQGYAEAQNALGTIYYRGWGGVPKDIIISHMWNNVSSTNGNDYSRQIRDLIQQTMTPQAIEQAQAMARECMSSNYQNCGY